MLAIFAVGALAVLVADEALVVALAVLLRAACFLAVAPLPRELAFKGQTSLHHHLVDGLRPDLAEFQRVLAALAVAVDTE